jgi:predicted ester cyclase
MHLDDNKRIALESFRIIETGEAAPADRIIAADFVNREAEDDPDQPDRNLKGPAGFMATSRWLSGAFSELRFEDFEVIAEDHRVVVRATMSGRHTGTFQRIAPTGRHFRQRQIHLFRLHAGKIVEHLAQRDDLGLLLQLGWRPAERPTTV